MVAYMTHVGVHTSNGTKPEVCQNTKYKLTIQNGVIFFPAKTVSDDPTRHDPIPGSN